MEEIKNHFIYRKHFPESKSILSRKGKGRNEIFKNAIFVLDTNSLLVPYSIGKENIEKIGKTYKELISKDRLYIPEHALKEFAKNRSVRIAELFTTIDNHLSSLPTLKLFEYPILGDLKAYKDLNKSRETIVKHIKDYKKNLEDLKSGIVDWNWSDPVTNMYQNTFNENILINPSGTEDELFKEYKARINDDIPPGNKDKSKDSNAIGDYLIWKSILELGKSKKKDIIFVSNDEKNDWLLKGNQKSISTKFELVDEFYRVTEGFDFMSITFNSFLNYEGLEIDISQIFKDIEDLFNLPSEPKVSTFNTLEALSEIHKLITEYLLKAQQDPEDVYIDQKIGSYIKLFNDNYKAEYFGTSYWSVYFNYFSLFRKCLEEIETLNSHILYNAYRHKRDTTTESIMMLALCKEFIVKYAEFELL